MSFSHDSDPELDRLFGELENLVPGEKGTALVRQLRDEFGVRLENAERREKTARAEVAAIRAEADRAIKALAESEQRYRYMGETIPFGVWWCNPQGEAEYVSPSFCELLDMTLEEQKKFGWTQRLVPEDVEPMMTKWLNCCATGTPWDHEHRIIDRHGKVHTVLSRGLPVRNPDGRIIAWVGVNLDITDRKRIELQLKEAKEALEKALQVKDQFFANLSHELRTPLTLILGPARKLIKSGELGDAPRRDLLLIERNARTLLKTVNDLLDLSKLDAGQVGTHYATGDLARLARYVASHFESASREKPVGFSVAVPDALPAEIDAEKVQRVLFNLLGNAFKFTPPEGAVRLTLREADGRAEFFIDDTGPGIPPEMRERIFERFRQIDGSATRRHGGTGLGLAIAREFVRLHRGTIEVEGAPGGGARFVVRLPLHAPQGTPVAAVGTELDDDAAQTLVAELKAPTVLPLAASTPADAPHALVVEDSAEMRAFIAEALAPGYRIAFATDGRDGLEKAIELRPDLIVTDVMMPRLSGDELVREARLRRELDDVPILVLTAKADEQVRIGLLQAGAQDCLTKPFATEELVARAGRLVAHKRQAQRILAAERELLTRIIDTIPVMITIFDPAQRTFRFNRELRDVLGWTEADAADGDFMAKVYPDPAERHRAAEFMQSLAPGWMDFEVTAKDGRKVLSTWANVRLANDVSVGIGVDVRARREAEEALRDAVAEAQRRAIEAEERERIFSAMMEHIPMGITIADAPDVNIRAVSRYGRELLAKPEEQIANIPASEHPRRWDIYRADGSTPATADELPLTRATQKGEIVNQEEWVVGRSDGVRIPILCTAGPIRDRNGDIVGGVIGWQDISDRKRIEEQLRRTAQRLIALNRMGRILSSNLDLGVVFREFVREIHGVFTFDRMTFVVPRPEQDEWEVIHQWSRAPDAPPQPTRGPLRGSSIEWLAREKKPLIEGVIGPDWTESALEVNVGVRSRAMFPLVLNDAVTAVFTVSNHDYAAFTVDTVSFLQGLADHLVVAVQNSRLYAEVQEHAAELERRVAERTRQLEDANRELEAFSYSVSHDLRAPLRAIAGFSNILVEEHAAELTPQAARYAGLVQNGARRMGQLIDDLLAFSRLGRHALSVREVDIGQIAREVAAEMNQDLPGRTVEWRIGDLPPCQADPSLIRHVMTNLLSNAAKYSAPRAVAVIEVGATQHEHGPVVYHVRDNGVGFDMKYASKLFGVFQRLHRAEEFEGTGVGLAIVQRIVHRHGGRIWAESEPGVGSTFYFTLEGGSFDERTSR